MEARRIFVLTGAGVSAESGLGTFRDPGGLWRRYDPMTLATPEAFAQDPALVHEFYNLRRRAAIAAQPNVAHHAIARLQTILRERDGTLFLCTQNVDDLHERAGSGSVFHMHGTLLGARCLQCETRFAWREDLNVETPCPVCDGLECLRPDVVWFGETPLHRDAIDAALQAADLFVAIGTSGAVYPAAGFVAQARALGIKTCELNLDRADNAAQFDEARYGSASEIVPAFVESLCGRDP